MKNPSTVILAKLSIIALLIVPSISHADMEELIELQREQLQIQREILNNQNTTRNNMMLYGKPDPFMADPVQPDISAEIEEAARNLQYQARKDADREANEYYPEH